METDMDMMDLATKMLGNKLAGADAGAVKGVVSKLLGGDDGGIDLGSIVNSLQSKGLGDIASSWLGA
jgi:uncharacterized protein YidB (DUF937 family)